MHDELQNGQKDGGRHVTFQGIAGERRPHREERTRQRSRSKELQYAVDAGPKGDPAEVRADTEQNP